MIYQLSLYIPTLVHLYCMVKLHGQPSQIDGDYGIWKFKNVHRFVLAVEDARNLGMIERRREFKIANESYDYQDASTNPVASL